MSHESLFQRIAAAITWMVAMGLVALGPGASPACAGEAAPQVILNVTFDDKKMDEDLTGEWRFFAEASSTTVNLTPAQVKREGAKFLVKDDPTSPGNKVLQLAGGDTALPDAWIYVPSLTNTELNKGDYTAVQLDFYAQPGLKKAGRKKIDKRAGPYRIGVLGFIDLDDRAVYGAWMRWSDRQVRAGRMVEGRQEIKRSTKFGKRKDVNRWYTIRAEFTRQGDQIEVKGKMWDRMKGEAKAATSTFTVPLTAKKTFAIGIFQYTDSDKFGYDKRYIDNIKVIRAK
jgi:hypothetical protein